MKGLLERSRPWLIAEPVVVASILLGTIAMLAFGFTDPGTQAHDIWLAVDVLVVLYFIVEQCLKMRVGREQYWATRWNRFDLLVTVLSLPVLVAPFAETDAFVGVPVLRLARLFRLFRLLRFVPDHAHLASGVKRAVRASVGVFLGIAIINFIFAMGGQILFGHLAPELFGDPARACYSMFRIFTIEGWHDIPETIAKNSSETWAVVARVYFGVAVLVGGILGLSLGNAVFVDQMMADNNDEVERDVVQMTNEVRLLREEIRHLREQLGAAHPCPASPPSRADSASPCDESTTTL
jgi:voltage-gated sodium channel